MKNLDDILKESILDMDPSNTDIDSVIHLKQFNEILYKRAHNHTKECVDMFGREIKVGDVCLANVAGCEMHFIQIKEIVDEGGWAEIVPTVSYKHIDGYGLVHPVNCILIPKKWLNNFLKFMKSKK